MGTKCEKIATPGELGGDPFFKKLAAAAKNGDPAVIETCDVTARYGESVYSNKDIEELFFLGEQHLAEPNTIKNALKFYNALPTRKTLQGIQKKSLAKKSLQGQVRPQLDGFFRAVRAAHERYNIPYIFEGDLAPFVVFHQQMNTLASDPKTARQGIALGSAIIEWTCGSPHFPEPFFNKVAQEIVADAMSAQLFGKDDPDQSYRLCLTAATPLAARREHLS